MLIPRDTPKWKKIFISISIVLIVLSFSLRTYVTAVWFSRLEPWFRRGKPSAVRVYWYVLTISIISFVSVLFFLIYILGRLFDKRVYFLFIAAQFLFIINFILGILVLYLSTRYLMIASQPIDVLCSRYYYEMYYGNLDWMAMDNDRRVQFGAYYSSLNKRDICENVVFPTTILGIIGFISDIAYLCTNENLRIDTFGNFVVLVIEKIIKTIKQISAQFKL